MVQDPIAGAPLLRAMSAHSVAGALQDSFVEFLIYRLSSRDVLMMNQPINVKEWNQHGLDIGLHLLFFLQSRRWCHVPLEGHALCFRVIPVNPALVTSDYRGHEVGIVLFALTSQRSVQTDTRLSCSAVSRRGTNFAVTHLICKSSVRIFWPIPNAILTSSATSLIVRRRSTQMIPRISTTVSSVWEVDGLTGLESSSKDRRPLLKRQYNSNVFNQLRLHSLKAACSISHVSAPVFQTETEIDAHTLLHFPLYREMRRTLQVDVQWKASTEQMRRDTKLWSCTYTSIQLTHITLCCHLAKY